MSSAKNATWSRSDLRPGELLAVARAEKRDRRGFDEGEEAAHGPRQIGDPPERDGDLAVGALPCLGEGRGPGILVAVQHQEARCRTVPPDRRHRAEEHRAIAAYEERAASGAVRVDDPVLGGLHEARERGLVEDARRTALTAGLLEQQVAGVFHPERSKLLGDTAFAQRADRVRDPARLLHRGVRDSRQLPGHLTPPPSTNRTPGPGSIVGSIDTM